MGTLRILLIIYLTGFALMLMPAIAGVFRVARRNPRQPFWSDLANTSAMCLVWFCLGIAGAWAMFFERD